MQAVLFLSFVLAILVIANSVHASATIIKASKDTTILYGTGCTFCPQDDCKNCALGHSPSLITGPGPVGGPIFARILIGFELPVPASSVQYCSIILPPLKASDSFQFPPLFLPAASSDWSEDTVTGENAPPMGNRYLPGNVIERGNRNFESNITQACKAADDKGHFSVYVEYAPRRMKIPSKDAGKPVSLYIEHS
ncbi:hypothetical protein BG000_010502 [Podila horticola]|nr:hypothetical protein BG000_010502 [Podila horticola]